MKIESVRANNRKKAFEIETRTGAYTFPYALLHLKPDPKNRITEAFPDEDLGKEGFTYRLAKGGAAPGSLSPASVISCQTPPERPAGLAPIW